MFSLLYSGWLISNKYCLSQRRNITHNATKILIILLCYVTLLIGATVLRQWGMRCQFWAWQVGVGDNRPSRATDVFPAEGKRWYTSRLRSKHTNIPGKGFMTFISTLGRFLIRPNAFSVPDIFRPLSTGNRTGPKRCYRLVEIKRTTNKTLSTEALKSL